MNDRVVAVDGPTHLVRLGQRAAHVGDAFNPCGAALERAHLMARIAKPLCDLAAEHAARTGHKNFHSALL